MRRYIPKLRNPQKTVGSIRSTSKSKQILPACHKRRPSKQQTVHRGYFHAGVPVVKAVSSGAQQSQTSYGNIMQAKGGVSAFIQSASAST